MMVTLNSGFKHDPSKSSKNFSADERDAIEAFIRERGVTQCPPATVPGNEASRHTHRHVMELRKEFRKANKKK
jgi:hypothetical protein